MWVCAVWSVGVIVGYVYTYHFLYRCCFVADVRLYVSSLQTNQIRSHTIKQAREYKEGKTEDIRSVLRAPVPTQMLAPSMRVTVRCAWLCWKMRCLQNNLFHSNWKFTIISVSFRAACRVTQIWWCWTTSPSLLPCSSRERVRSAIVIGSPGVSLQSLTIATNTHNSRKQEYWLLPS